MQLGVNTFPLLHCNIVPTSWDEQENPVSDPDQLQIITDPIGPKVTDPGHYELNQQNRLKTHFKLDCTETLLLQSSSSILWEGNLAASVT